MQSLLLSPVDVGGVRLRNRVVLAPMSRVSTRGDGVATPEMAAYYAEFASGGFGLIITEGTYTDDVHSQAYLNQPGIVTEPQVDAWAKVVDEVHDQGGRIFLQLMHAGALVQGDFQSGGAVAPSAVQPRGRMLRRGYGGDGAFPVPRAMTHADIARAVEGFARAASLAQTAGFDGVEVHAANGYLLDQFLTPYTNLRRDRYGGSVENRIRLTVEVIEAIQHSAGRAFPVGVRISQGKVNDPDHRWDGVAEAEAILMSLGETRPAYIHVASENADWSTGTELGGGVTISGLGRSVTSAPSIANGELHDPIEANEVIRGGHADLVAIGRGALANPDWPRRVAEGRELHAYDSAMLLPEVTLANARRWRSAARPA